MRDISSYFKKIILILAILLFILFIFLLWTHKYFNESTFPIIIMIFWWIIIGLFFLVYKFFPKKIFLITIIFILSFIIFSMANWILYQKHTKKLKIGMERQAVQTLYWSWTSWIWYGSYWLWSADCTKCNWISYQFSYRFDWNLWYSHLEDSYHVCYIKEKVCDFDRIWL